MDTVVVSGSRARGRLVEVVTEAESVSICVAFAPRAATVALHSDVDLEIARAGGPPVACRARAVRRIDRRETTLLVFRAEGPADLAWLLRGETRQAFRVEPLGPVEVRVRADPARDAQPVAGRLADLSPEGAGVVLAPEADRLLGTVGALRIELQLGAETVELACSVRARRELPAGVLYGLQFDPAGSRDFARTQRIVTAYVLRCQQARRHERLRRRRAG